MNGLKSPLTRAIIFDCDGTIVDSLADIADAMNESLAYFGYETHTIKQYKYFLGDGVKKLVERSINSTDKEKVEEVYLRYNKNYHDSPTNKTTAYEGIVELLKYCKDNSILTFVLTNKDQDLANTVVETIFGKDAFNEIVGLRDGILPKPSQTGVDYLVNKYHLKKKNLYYVGDTATDMKTCTDAHIDIRIGATYGFRTKKELLDNGATQIVDNPIEIINVIADQESKRNDKKDVTTDSIVYFISSMVIYICLILYFCLNNQTIYVIGPIVSASICLVMAFFSFKEIKQNKQIKIMSSIFSFVASLFLLINFAILSIFIGLKTIDLTFYLLLGIEAISLLLVIINGIILLKKK